MAEKSLYQFLCAVLEERYTEGESLIKMSHLNKRNYNMAPRFTNGNLQELLNYLTLIWQSLNKNNTAIKQLMLL